MALQKQYNIKWRQSDYLTLGRAVAQFNKKINELNKEEQKLYLPELMNYLEVKQGITTRNELNRVIKSLRRFLKEGAEELYTTVAGEQMTKWERRELGIQSRIASKRLRQEIKELYTPTQNGFSRAQMGSQRAREAEAELRTLSQIENRIGYDFQKLVRRIKKIGTTDYTLKMSYQYQENFMKELEDLKNNEPEFEKVFEYFSKIKNPIEFFNVTQRSKALQDFFTWYKTPENYAGFKNAEDVADYIISQYQLEDDENYGEFKDIENEEVEEIEVQEETTKRKKKKYKYSLVTRRGVVIKQSDSIYDLRQTALNSTDSEIANSLIILNK